MSSNLPSSGDPEEADAAHPRFLPQHSRTYSNTANFKSSPMANGRAPKDSGGDNAGGTGGNSEADADILKDSEGNENEAMVKAKNDSENNFLSLKDPSGYHRQEDYGSTGSFTILKGDDVGQDDVGEVDSPSVKVPPENVEDNFGFGLKFLRRFYRLHGVLFLSTCSTAFGLFLFLLSLVLLQEYIVYQVGLIASGYYKTLGDKDLNGFWMQTLKSMGLILAVSFVKSTTQYIQKVLTVTFRKILCEACHRLYFAEIRFYQLNVLDKAIDNPDQRMTQDIDKFCSTYCEVLPKLIVSPFTIAYYCYQGYQRSGWEGPVGCLGFFIFATSVNRLLMNPIVNYVVKQEKCEGDFRFLHMLIRVNSESIAFQQAGLVEHGKVDNALTKLADTQHSLYLRQYFLSFFINFFEYIGSIFSYLILAIPIFSGRYNHLTPSDLGFLISQNAFILIYLIYTFTSLVDLSGKFTDVAGVSHRISQLIERLNTLEDFWKEVFPPDHGRQPDSNYFSDWTNIRQRIVGKLEFLKKAVINAGDYIGVDLTGHEKGSKRANDVVNTDSPKKRLLVWSLDNVSFSAPRTNSTSASLEPLISNLTMDFVVGESILISGPSSAGKTSILRLLRGLWPQSSGTLKCYFPPGPQGVYFCPQKSYLTWGTLRDQISFPLEPTINYFDDNLMLYYLDKLKLTAVAERIGGLDVFCSWSVYDSLSPGEIQRLCLLRIFYHQPVVAVLDEVTSALPLDIEDFVYSELKRLGVTLISVGHRESIRKYHDKQLIINSKGGWALYPIIHE